MDDEDEHDAIAEAIAARKRKEALERKKRRVGGGVEVQEESKQLERIPASSSAKDAAAAEQAADSAQVDRGESLLQLHKRMREEQKYDPELAKKQKQEEDERRVLESAMGASVQALVSAQERAGNARPRERVKRAWTAQPEPEEVTRGILATRLFYTNGENIPPPVSCFENMSLPHGIVDYLKDKGIVKPTPIQMQGVPVLLSGRDMIGVASTGSGKTLTFLIPAIVCSIEQETKEGRLRPGEGPFVLILGPSRELQRQTWQIADEMCRTAFGPNRFSITLAIGGESKQSQLSNHRRWGSHILIGTPGRVSDYLSSRDVNLKRCTQIILDEGDRMVDEGFDEEVKRIISFLSNRPRQTVLFSATMPLRVLEFAKEALIDAVTVNVGRAGAASSNITQYIEPVSNKERFVCILDALERTPPPVLVFATRNGDVDDIYEYLMLKGLEVRAIHSGKSQQDRNQAVDEFKDGKADILVASDVAAKGLDFPGIEHVINFDMPPEIENYIHRIGRTGRGGKKGVATTFVDPEVISPTLMKDLFGILRDAKQRAPLFLIGGEEGKFDEPVRSDDKSSSSGLVTCSVCGGFGHRVTECPRLATLGKKNLTRDVVTGGDY